MNGHIRDDVHLSHNPEHSRYEIRVGGELAGTAEYAEETDSVALSHTVVRREFRRQGYSSMLVRFAVEDIVASGRRVKPYCSYAASYLEKHGEYSHHVSWPQAAR